MSTHDFPLDGADVETLRRIEGRMRSARMLQPLSALLPFLTISTSAIGTAVSVSTFQWTLWAEAVRGGAVRTIVRSRVHADVEGRWLELVGVTDRQDPHIRARRDFWMRMLEPF